MSGLDKSDIEDILCRLEEQGHLFPGYKLYKVNEHPCLLGKGGFSLVYEMLSEYNPEKHYAMKVIGLGEHTIASDEFRKTTGLQQYLYSQTAYIARIMDISELRVVLDEQGKLIEAGNPVGERWRDDGILLQFVLMEKLDNVLTKDKFGKATFARPEMQTETEVIRFAMQIGQAILTAHNNNVLHRDIKLENIFWDADEKKYKLGDFGIAKYVEGGNAETIVYTDGYGAPEIERRLNDHYNATADIYSFGITLYLLLNELRFPGSDDYHVNLIQYSEDFVFPAPQNSSDGLTRIVRKMCSYHREDRYQSVSEVLNELNRISEPKDQTDIEDYVELADVETETFRDDKADDPRAEGMGPVKSTRWNRKQQLKELENYYTGASIFYLVVLSLLITLFLAGMQTDISVAGWQLWILPAAVLIEAALLRLKEFHIIFGILIFLIGGYLTFISGFCPLYFILLACTISGVPVLAASGAIGSGLWMGLVLTGKISWLRFLQNRDLSWITVILLLFTINKLVMLRMYLGKSSQRRSYVWMVVCDSFPVFMIIMGILLLILGHFEVVVILETIRKLHFIRVGIALFVLNIIEYALYGKETVEDDVPMDK